jgi:large subunit ribosomal protein L5
MKSNNSMRGIKIDKLVISCGAVGEKLDRSMKLLKFLTDREPVKTTTKKRMPAFSLRPGLEIGCKVTLRGSRVQELLKKFLEVNGNQLTRKQIGEGVVNFGIHEYIEIPGLQFQREIGILGFDVSLSLRRAGFNVGLRKIKRGRIPSRHKITKEETVKFMQENFNTTIVEKETKK